MTPTTFVLGEIVTQREAIDVSLPPHVISLKPRAIATAAGNIANDPLRTIQGLPSTVASGVDFNSQMSVRGGDPEEHRVYLDGYPLQHDSHADGFTEMVLGDVIGEVVFIPGAAPLRYRGNLSGVVSIRPVDVQSDEFLFRYDITSIAGGLTRRLGPRTTLIATAKSSFFNLPVYQSIGIDERTFRDGFAKLSHRTESGVDIDTTVLVARDSEVGDPVGDVVPRRSTSSVLVGTTVAATLGAWHLTARPYGSWFLSKDRVTARATTWDHRLSAGYLNLTADREWQRFGMTAQSEIGWTEHGGRGPKGDKPAHAHHVEGRFALPGKQRLVAGVGSNREPFATHELESYGAWRAALGSRVSLAAGYRRSHQSPFDFSDDRRFASIPVDPGDLSAAAGTGVEAPAVRLDQLSARVQVQPLAGWSLSADVYRRDYDNLLTWAWDDDFVATNVRSDGDGRSVGYELAVTRQAPGGLQFALSRSQALVQKREGTLSERRVADFDVPEAWRLQLSYRLNERFTLSAGWQDRIGTPYTPFDRARVPPDERQVNATRLPRYQRLDVKLDYRALRGTTDIDLFVDVLNVLNRSNIAVRDAVEADPGEFTSYLYSGVRFFPIVGIAVKTW